MTTATVAEEVNTATPRLNPITGQPETSAERRTRLLDVTTTDHEAMARFNRVVDAVRVEANSRKPIADREAARAVIGAEADKVRHIPGGNKLVSMAAASLMFGRSYVLVREMVSDRGIAVTILETGIVPATSKGGKKFPERAATKDDRAKARALLASTLPAFDVPEAKSWFASTWWAYASQSEKVDADWFEPQPVAPPGRPPILLDEDQDEQE